MICYVLAMGKQHLGPHVVVGYGIKIFWPGLFITSPDHLVGVTFSFKAGVYLKFGAKMENFLFTENTSFTFYISTERSIFV